MAPISIVSGPTLHRITTLFASSSWMVGKKGLTISMGWGKPITDNQDPDRPLLATTVTINLLIVIF